MVILKSSTNKNRKVITMKIVSISEIIDLNNILNENQIHYKVHLSDACGGQSFWLENLDTNQEKGMEDIIRIIDTFFEEKRIPIQYSENKMSFWTVR